MNESRSHRARVRRLLTSAVDPRPWLHVVRLVHYYNYSHVVPLSRVRLGEGVTIAPNVSLRNGSRISIGAGSQIGAHCCLWAGDNAGRIIIGDKALFGPEVFITASNYRTVRDVAVLDQPSEERDVWIGAGVWLGARVIVLPGVTIGEGCVVGAGAVVTKDMPANSIAVGSPAKVVATRGAKDA